MSCVLACVRNARNACDCTVCACVVLYVLADNVREFSCRLVIRASARLRDAFSGKSVWVGQVWTGSGRRQQQQWQCAANAAADCIICVCAAPKSLAGCNRYTRWVPLGALLRCVIIIKHNTLLFPFTSQPRQSGQSARE